MREGLALFQPRFVQHPRRGGDCFAALAMTWGGGGCKMTVIASPCADGFPAQGRGNLCAGVEIASLRSQ